MFEGFIRFVVPSRGSFMFDLVAVAMFVVLPILSYSIYVVRVEKNYTLHKRLQLLLGVVLLITVVLFEMDIRLHPWKFRVESSPYFQNVLYPFLAFHVFIACTTSLLWIITIAGALWNFPSPPRPGAYSRRHLLFARPAAIGMFLTAATGWTFYYMAFIATVPQ